MASTIDSDLKQLLEDPANGVLAMLAKNRALVKRYRATAPQLLPVHGLEKHLKELDDLMSNLLKMACIAQEKNVEKWPEAGEVMLEFAPEPFRSMAMVYPEKYYAEPINNEDQYHAAN